jgi:hypothetical protein
MNTIYRRVKQDSGQCRHLAVNIGKGRRPENLGSKFYARIERVGARWQSSIPLDGDTLEQAMESAKS